MEQTNEDQKPRSEQRPDDEDLGPPGADGPRTRIWPPFCYRDGRPAKSSRRGASKPKGLTPENPRDDI